MIWLLISAWFLFGFILAVGIGKIIHHIDQQEPHVDKTWKDKGIL